jgi:hypothetical protein
MNNSNDERNPDPSLADRRKIVDEIHSYTRHNMQIWAQWFGFFLTVNYLAIGWFADKIATNTLRAPGALVCVGALFIVQGTLGIWASLVWRRDLSKMRRDLSMVYDTLLVAPAPTKFSHGAYEYAIAIGAIALLGMIGAWLVMVILWGHGHLMGLGWSWTSYGTW